jgi:tetratricopeptide (TPR) repeat protein
VKAALDGVLLFQAEADKDGADLAREYNVKGYPTFVMVNSDEQTIARWIGYSRGFFLETMEAEMVDLSTIDEKKARFAASPALGDALALARYSYSLDQNRDAVNYYQKAQELNPDEDYSYDIFTNTISGVPDSQFTYDQAVMAAEAVFNAANTGNEVYAAGRMSRLAEMAEKPEDMAGYLERGLGFAENATDENIQKYALNLKVDYNLKVLGDKPAAVELKKSTYDDGWTEDANQLNSFAWWCYVNDVNLKEAEQLAEKAVELSEPGRSKAMILDTVAHICKSRGNMDDAIKYMQMAVDEDPESEDWKSTLEEFKEELQES